MRFSKTLLVAAMAALFSVNMNAQCCGEGCEAEQLGYKVQPFAENDRNRCVIIVGDFK